jgi:hypothetical protein
VVVVVVCVVVVGARNIRNVVDSFLATRRYYMPLSVVAAGLALHSALSLRSNGEDDSVGMSPGASPVFAWEQSSLDAVVESILSSFMGQLAFANLACACLYYIYALVVQYIFTDVNATEQTVPPPPPPPPPPPLP